mgnify:FL=1
MKKEIYCVVPEKDDFLHQQDCIDTAIVFWIVCNLEQERKATLVSCKRYRI